MSKMKFDCEVTEHHIKPKKENDENSFCIDEKALIIQLMDSERYIMLAQTEIEKEDAIQLAKLILLKYNVN